MAKLKALLLPLVPLLLMSAAPVGEFTEVSVEARNPAELRLTEWAIARYGEAGLELPPLLIRFPGDDLSHCGGAQARAYLSHNPVEVRICWGDRFELLHELAHVWVANNLPAGRREPFVEMRDGVEAWSSRSVAWEARGSEHAANVIAWGLLEEPYPISRTYPNDVASMMDAFTFLTDAEALHTGGDGVQLPDRTLYDGRQNPPLETGR